jgi:hypothetical protein
LQQQTSTRRQSPQQQFLQQQNQQGGNLLNVRSVQQNMLHFTAVTMGLANFGFVQLYFTNFMGYMQQQHGHKIQHQAINCEQ